MKCGKSYEGVVHTEYLVLGFWHKMVLASNLGYPLCNCVYLKISPCYKMQFDVNMVGSYRHAKKNGYTSEITEKRTNGDLVPTLEQKNNNKLVFGHQHLP